MTHGVMADAVPTITTGSPSSPHSSPSSRPGSPSRGLRRPASHSRLAKLMLPGRSRSSSSASATNEVAYADEISSTVSGRTTPEQRRRVGKAAATSLLASDAKYKKFAGMVDKSLSSFESVNEWADFISFLSRLLKTLQSPSPTYNEIPRKLIISKRLAQCLNPALPSGVHQRALDVYGYIFSTIGTEGLRRDLLTWSSGLFPFFQYAATSVRPLLINLYETHYLPLGDDLRPATKALILALLPALEEETGDFFDRVYTLFGRLSEAVSPLFFTQNIFLTLISNPSSRLAALNYLSKSLSKPSNILENKSDVGLMVRGVAAVLKDENMLVRRNGLDLLLRITPLDGPIFSESETQDKELLVRAACSVVLQREVSLSRRVYTWFLGKGESPDEQIAYFRTYGLDLLSKVLKDDMDSLGLESQSLDAQRPFKIFLSLLDRWEIGAALSDRLVVPALEAIRSGLPRVSPSIREEMLDTATAVYEAVEPIVVWRAMFTSVASALADHTQDDSLLSWVIASLPQQDEEVLSLHIPAVTEYLLQQQLTTTPTDASILNLALALLKLMPTTLLSRSAADPALSEPGSIEKRWTERVYGSASLNLQNLVTQAKTTLPPQIVSATYDLCTSLLARRPMDTTGVLKVIEMTGLLIDAECPSLKNVQSRAWLGRIVKSLPTTHSFELVDALISVALKASRCPAIEPVLKLSEAPIMTVLLDTLMRFLRPECATFHARAVELLWECNQLADPHTLENVVAARLTDPIKHSEAYDAFGVLWRLTDDTMLPGELFYTPILTIMDGLNALDPLQRQRAQTWVRKNLATFFRVLDPVISRLGETSGDRDVTTYLLDVVSTIVQLGDSDLRSACQNTELRRSAHPTLIRKADTVEGMTYNDFMVEIAINHLRTEPDTTLHVPKSLSAPKASLRIQSSALGLLGHLIGDGDISTSSLVKIRDALIAELRLAIRQSQLTLQTQMLSLLRQCMETPHPPSFSKSHQRKRSQINEKSQANNEADSDLAIVQVVIEGVSIPPNRPILQSWVDFILAVAPVFPKNQSTVLMLCECFSDQLRRVLLQLRAMYRDTSNTSIVVADSEPVLLLLALEQMISLAFASGGNTRMSDDGPRSHGEGGGTGLMGLVSGVFTVEAPSNEKMSDSIQYLDDAINALLLAWSITGQSYARGPAAVSEARVFAQTRSRAREVLERLFKSQPSVVVGSSIQVWAALSADIEDEAIFDCIDHLAPSAQKVVEIVAEAVVGRQGKGASETISDPAVMGFLEVYVSRLEAPIAVQIWNTLFNFARDVLSTSSSTGKAQLYPVLRCLTIVCKTVSTTSALEDRRLRRDLQDVYLRLLDGVVSNANKSAESALWKRDTSNPELSVEKTSDKAIDDGLSALHDYIASHVVPNLRSFLADSDKVAAAAAIISSGLIQPAFRRQKVDASVLHVLLELAKLPSATKAWRLQVGEAFNDQRFFKISLKDSNRWKLLICALMDSDRERFGELLGRITAAPSANIFTNREQEMISRSLNLRRLSFILLAAERNHYLAQLPSIQEKLVDILRTDVVSPRVHSEVYLCLRVLMCRVSPQHLTNFWPVILTELIKVFESTMDDPPIDGSEDLTLILAACKFLDLLLIIQSEDFQVHQWMFVTDTTDAAYPPEDFLPEAIMDRLSEIMSEHRHTSGGHAPIQLATDDDDSRSLRKPRLTAIHHLSSLYQLQPFFARASIDTFEGVYGDQGVDWDAVEIGLDREMFETKHQA